MRIYIASSWKNAREVRILANILEKNGHEVYDFTDESKHYAFNLNALTDASKIDYIDFLKNIPESFKAYSADREGLDWSNCVIMLLPCGRSSHLELGYGVGKGKHCFIYGDLPLGEYECMYHFVEKVYHKKDLEELLTDLRFLDRFFGGYVEI